MIEAYSMNVAVAANQPVPFNSVSLLKGCDVKQLSPTTFVLNKRGVYLVSLDAAGAVAGTTAATMNLQLYKNGVPQLQAQAQGGSTGATDIEGIGFVTLVQVEEDNNPCCCSSAPTTIQVVNNTTNGTIALNLTKANIVVKKIC